MSKRTEQVAELLRAEINNIILRDFEAPTGSLVSISAVTVSADLKNATALVSIIPENKIGSAMAKFTKFGGHIQREIGKHINIKTTPHIKWELDERGLKYAAIDEALKNT